MKVTFLCFHTYYRLFCRSKCQILSGNNSIKQNLSMQAHGSLSELFENFREKPARKNITHLQTPECVRAIQPQFFLAQFSHTIIRAGVAKTLTILIFWNLKKVSREATLFPIPEEKTNEHVRFSFFDKTYIGVMVFHAGISTNRSEDSVCFIVYLIEVKTSGLNYMKVHLARVQSLQQTSA